MSIRRKTWIVPVQAHDGRKLFVSVHARTRSGAVWAYWFNSPAETGDDLATLATCDRIGVPVELNAWLAARVSA